MTAALMVTLSVGVQKTIEATVKQLGDAILEEVESLDRAGYRVRPGSLEVLRSQFTDGSRARSLRVTMEATR